MSSSEELAAELDEDEANHETDEADEIDAAQWELLDSDEEIRPTSSVGRFARGTATGAILTGMAIGLQQIFDPNEHEQIAIVQPAPEEPDTPRAVEAFLDPDDPTQSSVLVRNGGLDVHEQDSGD